jgi:hypothetical protein
MALMPPAARTTSASRIVTGLCRSVAPRENILSGIYAPGSRLILGATVTGISIGDMRDIYETRLVLEDHAIRAAVAGISPHRAAPQRSRHALNALPLPRR